MIGKRKNHTWLYFVKGIVLIILGAALWYNMLSLDTTIAILLILAGLKMFLVPALCK